MRAGWPSTRSARPAYHGAPPSRGSPPSTTSRARCPITASGRIDAEGYSPPDDRHDEPERECNGEARERGADAAVRRGQPGEKARPEPEILRLRGPLVQGEAHEPGRDHPRPHRRAAEDVVAFVVAAGDEPVREQYAEQRNEERAEQEQELLIPRQVDAERDRRRHDGDSDDQYTLRRTREEVLQRDRGRVDVRERLVRLVDRQRE